MGAVVGWGCLAVHAGRAHSVRHGVADDHRAGVVLTNNFSRDIHGDLVVSGDQQIIETVVQTRAIIGTPK